MNLISKEKLNQKINTQLESEKALLIQQTKKTLRELQSQIDRSQDLEKEKLKEIDQALIHFIAELKKYEHQLQEQDKEFLAKLEGDSPDKDRLKEKIQRLERFIQKHESGLLQKIESESFGEINSLNHLTEQELKGLANEHLTTQLKTLASKGRAEKLVAQFLDRKYIKKEKLSGFRDRIVENIGLPLAGIFIGKESQNLIAQIESLANQKVKLPEKIIKGATNGIQKTESVTEAIKNTPNPKIPEKQKELLSEAEKKATTMKQRITKSLPSYIQSITGKTLSAEQVKKVISKLNLEEKYKDAQSSRNSFFTYLETEKGSGNLVETGFLTAQIPFEIFVELTAILMQEGIINSAEIIQETTQQGVRFGLKGVTLMGDAFHAMTGEMSRSQVGEKITRIYSLIPEQANILLYRLIYGSRNNIILKISSSLAVSVSKMLMRTMVESSDQMKTLSLSTDMYHKNLDKVLEPLEQLMSKLPPALTGNLGKTIQEFKTLTLEMKATNEAYKLLHTAPKTLPAGQTLGNRIAETLEQKHPEMAPKNGKNLQILNDIKGVTDTSKLKKVLGNGIQAIGTKASNNINNWIKIGVELMPGLTKGVRQHKDLLDLVEMLKTECKLYGDQIKGNNIFKRVSRMNALSSQSFDVIQQSNKALFKFDSKQKLKQFLFEAKALAKESPNTLKFLLGKTPLIVLTGMSIEQQGNKDNALQKITQDLMSLIPIVGPSMIMREGAGYGKGKSVNRREIGIGAALLTYDGCKIVSYASKKERLGLMKFASQPVVDAYEILKFLFKSTKNILRIPYLGYQALMTSPKAFGKELIKPGRVGRIALLALAVRGGVEATKYLLGDDHKELQEFMKTMETDRKGALENLKKERKTLSNNEKAEIIKIGLITRMGNIDPEDCHITYEKNKLKISRGTIPPRVTGTYGAGIKTIEEDFVRSIADLEGQKPEISYYFGGVGNLYERLRKNFTQLKVHCQESGISIEEFIKQDLGYSLDNNRSNQDFEEQFRKYL